MNNVEFPNTWGHTPKAEEGGHKSMRYSDE
jgi:hypothetical protein